MIPFGGLVCHSLGMRRDDICLYLGPAERAQLGVEWVIGEALEKAVDLLKKEYGPPTR